MQGNNHFTDSVGHTSSRSSTDITDSVEDISKIITRLTYSVRDTSQGNTHLTDSETVNE